MKVITVDFLMQCIKEVGEDNLIRAGSLVNLLEEIDTVTVSKLRPMCDAPREESFMVNLNGGVKLYEGYIDARKNIWIGEQHFSEDLCSGWIPTPIYKPELNEASDD